MFIDLGRFCKRDLCADVFRSLEVTTAVVLLCDRIEVFFSYTDGLWRFMNWSTVNGDKYTKA